MLRSGLVQQRRSLVVVETNRTNHIVCVKTRLDLLKPQMTIFSLVERQNLRVRKVSATREKLMLWGVTWAKEAKTRESSSIYFQRRLRSLSFSKMLFRCLARTRRHGRALWRSALGTVSDQLPFQRQLEERERLGAWGCTSYPC